MTQVARGAQGEPAPQDVRETLAAMVRQEGEAAVVRRLGLGRQTLARALAGLPIREGTQAQLRERLGA